MSLWSTMVVNIQAHGSGGRQEALACAGKIPVRKPVWSTCRPRPGPGGLPLTVICPSSEPVGEICEGLGGSLLRVTGGDGSHMTVEDVGAGSFSRC
jgi:hypothetical protein